MPSPLLPHWLILAILLAPWLAMAWLGWRRWRRGLAQYRSDIEDIEARHMARRILSPKRRDFSEVNDE